VLILAIKTDCPLAELYLYNDKQLLQQIKWQAHRQLADTIHLKIKIVLGAVSKEYSDIGGLVIFRGPGSFTGLRIGASVFNASAYALNIPIVGVMGDTWLNSGIIRLIDGHNDKIVVPEYGGEAHITQPKK
jgi:tRNA threonylcarbamoyladenosine biosynthesis protein TsaB